MNKQLALAVCLLALMGAGCLPAANVSNTSGGGTTVTDSGVRGTATIGPTCPVERMPPDPACADKPYAGSFTIKTKSGTTVTTFSSAADGSFSVSLSPGTYEVNLSAGSVMPSMASQEFTVVAGAFTQLELSVDSGIR